MGQFTMKSPHKMVHCEAARKRCDYCCFAKTKIVFAVVIAPLFFPQFFRIVVTSIVVCGSLVFFGIMVAAMDFEHTWRSVRLCSTVTLASGTTSKTGDNQALHITGFHWRGGKWYE